MLEHGACRILDCEVMSWKTRVSDSGMAAAAMIAPKMIVPRMGG
jgi:hypothetical protein